MTVRLPAGVDANVICLASHVLNFAAVTMKGDFQNVVGVILCRIYNLHAE